MLLCISKTSLNKSVHIRRSHSISSTTRQRVYAIASIKSKDKFNDALIFMTLMMTTLTRWHWEGCGLHGWNGTQIKHKSQGQTDLLAHLHTAHGAGTAGCELLAYVLLLWLGAHPTAHRTLRLNWFYDLATKFEHPQSRNLSFMSYGSTDLKLNQR